MAEPNSKPNTTVFAPWTDPDAVPLIRFRNVTKRFGDFTAIDDLTLDIYEREFFALLGPSGCGKTTMMRMLAGFENPTEGRIEIGGQDMANVPPNLRAVNMMFQSYALFPHLSVYDNIAFGLKRSDMPKEQIPDRVNEMLRLTRLERFAKRKPHQISGGQRQRVALARSLAKAPKLLLLDEPLGALDKKLREETQFELMDIQEKTGTTFVIVTHDQEEAMTVASRVAVMDAGVIKQVDTPPAIYETPNSVYVADFIGDVNLIEGTAAKTGEHAYEITYAEGVDPIKVTECEHEIAEGAKVTFAIRPEKIVVTQDPPEDRANAMQGKIIDIGYLGNLSTYHVELPGGQMVKATMTNASRISRRDYTWEDTVWLGFRSSAGVVLSE
ncbi:putrescine transport system ATP-binding protein [Maritimibacter alkaliphilus HTCC2654]|jgi:putrescine transport system ATP-binding protein|uniref:Spermidine/putrescine import ATP-binding protein PotA n=1 Tax=Maritimibacter alkaliphilus HTCC2654 TaxID=314271 RepID=A3VAT8_9RHOB|nr:ABC transporter ATP-binding protein [Maritimibacter alkaliphilus]EAQ15029.1 putrescine ABC transporter, ATP-binding protein [Maritimibacter alkaliphilus HTCC2654]TYP80746.1 putrescine transport system ATP-binding protein [Maritimibacter alkaliphilus HTCC2654]